MPNWTCALALDNARCVTSGSRQALAAAVRRGADVRCYTTFDYGEHMNVPDSKVGLVQEMMNFPLTYWLEGEHTAAIQTTRYPANCSLGFGERPSLSFFLYNENGQFGIARPYLDGGCGDPRMGVAAADGRYRVLEAADDRSPCPCENATYEFGMYRWWVRDDWEEVLSHDAAGRVAGGSLAGLRQAFRAGRSLKVGVGGLCADLSPAHVAQCAHEVFTELGPIYNHEDQGFLGGESFPLVRVAPAVPLVYRSGNWNYGWILPRTDGIVHQLVIEPPTHRFIRTEGRHAIRWFAR